MYSPELICFIINYEREPKQSEKKVSEKSKFEDFVDILNTAVIKDNKVKRSQ